MDAPYVVIGTVDNFHWLGNDYLYRCASCGCAAYVTEEVSRTHYLRCSNSGCGNLGWLDNKETSK